MMNDTIYQVNRLIYLSKAYSYGKKAIVTRNLSEARELIQTYQAEPEFQKNVESGLRAMNLQILTVEDDGLRLSSTGSDELYSMTVTDYSRLLGRVDFKAADILVIHTALAAAFFPQETDLDAPVEDLGAVTQEDIIDILRQFAQPGSEEQEQDKAEMFHPQFLTLAQKFREMPEDNPDIRQSGSGGSWRELIDLAMKHMVKTGYLLDFEEREHTVEYRPTPAYQAAIREGMLYTFIAFQESVNTDSNETNEDKSNHV